MRKLLAIGAVALSSPPSALEAQVTSYRTLENYAITKSIGKGGLRQCWMLRGYDDSLLALTLSDKNEYGIAFSVKRDTVPTSLMVQIHGMPVLFSKEGPKYQKLFTNVLKRGTEHFFQTPLTALEMEELSKMHFIAFGELVTNKNYQGIGAGHQMKFSDEAVRIWHQCVREL